MSSKLREIKEVGYIPVEINNEPGFVAEKLGQLGAFAGFVAMTCAFILPLTIKAIKDAMPENKMGVKNRSSL